MLLLDNRHTPNPCLNLALEEFMVRYGDCSDDDYLLLYINAPSIVLGKNQSIYKEVNFEFLRNRKLLLARRISGGGAVYHDAGNLNFSFITKFADNKLNNYQWFNEKIVSALKKARIVVEMDARNNILYNGKKISGNAQFTNRKNILSHGTLLYDANLAVLKASLAENSFPVETKAVGSIRSPVMNISEINNTFKSTGELKDYLAGELTNGETKNFTAGEWAQIEELAQSKFKTYEWIYGRSPSTVIKKAGLEIEVENGLIRYVKTTNKLPDLAGLRYEYANLENALRGYPDSSAILTALF